MMIEILILSLVQGITEFLPISSSSHLILISKFSNFQYENLSIDVSLHIGSFIAVITYFHKDIYNFIENRLLFLKILISSVPVMLVGFLLVQTSLIDKFRNIEVIGWSTLVFGVLLYISDKFKLNKKIEKDLSFKSVVIIGLFQVLSLIPGVSRSGITITASRLLCFNRLDSAKISFLLSIPTLGAISVFGLTNIISSNNLFFSSLNLYSIFISFLFSLMTIKFFLKFIQRFSLNLFIIYRVILGLILIFVSYL